MGELEIMKRLYEIVVSIQKAISSDTNKCESCNNLKDIIAKIQEQISDINSCYVYSDQFKMGATTVSVQTEADDDICTLKKKISTLEATHVTEKNKLENVIK